MAKVLVTEAYLQDVANAIRQKNGSETVYTPGQMAAAIRAIPTGGGTQIDPSVYAELFKYVLLSSQSSDRFIRGTRYFNRDTSEPVLVLCGVYLSGGTVTYSGYAVISFASKGVSGTYTNYGNLTEPVARETPEGVAYWVQTMYGMFPPSTAGNRTQINAGNNQMYVYADVSGLVVECESSTLYGNADMILAMNALIDDVYLRYYAN